MDTERQRELVRAEIELGDFCAAHALLLPLVAQGVADAIYLAGKISKPRETETEFNRRNVASILLAAEGGSGDALYCLGRFYDVGGATIQSSADAIRSALCQEWFQLTTPCRMRDVPAVVKEHDLGITSPRDSNGELCHVGTSPEEAL